MLHGKNYVMPFSCNGHKNSRFYPMPNISLDEYPIIDIIIEKWIERVKYIYDVNINIIKNKFYDHHIYKSQNDIVIIMISQQESMIQVNMI